MPTGPAVNAELAIQHCRKIATFSDEAGATTRTFLSPAMRECLNYFTAWAERLGMNSRVDAAGNFRALVPGSGAKQLVIGSHLDSVPNAGAFDGVLGVVMGMLLAESFQEERPACTLEIVGFSEEEGVRFQRPFIGSTAFVAGLDAEATSLLDGGGISVKQAIQSFGLDIDGVHQPQKGQADAYLEFHIEQGPVLESLGFSLGIVDAIAGQTRAALEFTGQANHTGTTPMNLRRDAFCAAAEWTLLVEKMGCEHPGLVATVGKVNVLPNVVNIVPRSATLSLDLRHAHDPVRLSVFEALVREAQQIAVRRGVRVQSIVKLNQKAVPLSGDLISRLDAILPGLHHMTSGAGHDAMILAATIPSAMIFLRSPGGISHHPDETVLSEDVGAAFEVGRRFVQNFS